MRVWTTNWPPLFVLCIKFCCNSANYQTAGFVKKCTAVICTLMLLCHFKKNCEHIHGVHTLDLRVSEEHVYLRICNLECSIWCLYLWDTHFTPVRAVGCWVGHLNKEEQHFKLPCACVYYFLLVLERKKKSQEKKSPFSFLPIDVKSWTRGVASEGFGAESPLFQWQMIMVLFC